MSTTTQGLMTRPLPRRLNETGKIRIGCQVPIEQGKNAGKPRPERLKHFRLTSNSHAALQIAAQRYGGEVRPWIIRPEWKQLPQMREPDHKFELYTESNAIDIIMRADALMDTQFEQWDGAYCTRRCNGEFITFDGYGKLEGLECQCPHDLAERKATAAVCKPVSRLVMLLEGLPLGQWRLDTRGENTPAEIRGLQEILQHCGIASTMLRATMRLEFRTSRQMSSGKKEVYHYSCVVIEPRYTPEELLQLGQQVQRKQLAMPNEATKSQSEHIADLCGELQGDQAEVQAALAWEDTEKASPHFEVEPVEAIEGGTTSLPGLQNQDDSGAFQGHMQSSAWRDTLEAHQDNPLLQDGLRAKVKLALNSASQTTDAKGFALASAVLDSLDALQREAR